MTELMKEITIQGFIYSPVNFTPDPVYDDWTSYERLKRLRQPTKSIIDHTIGGTFLNGLLYGGVNVHYILPNFTSFPSPRSLLSPQKDININDRSLIVKLTYGKSKILICGDTEEEGWNKIADSKIKDTTLLLASHHGNNSGYCLEKVKAMSPQYVVISAGVGDHENGPKTNQDGSADDALMRKYLLEKNIVFPRWT